MMNEKTIRATKNQRGISELHRWWEEKRLDLGTGGKVIWNKKMKSLLIESFLLGIPCPEILLWEKDGGKYEVLDGRKRVQTIIKFFNNEFALEGLEVGAYKHLEGKLFSGLLPELANRLIYKTTIGMFEISRSTSQQLIKTIKKRLGS